MSRKLSPNHTAYASNPWIPPSKKDIVRTQVQATDVPKKKNKKVISEDFEQTLVF